MFTIHIDNVKHICCGAREYERVRNRLYGSRNDDDTRALFVLTDVWYRIESYHAAADLPRDCTDLYWRTPPRNFEIWKRDQLVSVTFGEVYELLWFVRRTDCTLRRLYERTRRWAVDNGALCEGCLFDKDLGQRLDLAQMLLDIYTHTFEIKP